MKVTSLFSLFLSFAVLRAAEYAWNLTETEWKAIQRSRLPRQHLSFNGLAPTRKKLLEEHGCRYNLSDTIIKLKPGSELTTSEHARFAQKTHDQSTEKGIGSWCKGVQTNFPIRDVEWYYHGCFALDALDLIEQHPDVSYSHILRHAMFSKRADLFICSRHGD